MNESLRIFLGCLLPTVFDLTLACGTKCRDITEVGRVEESVRGQLDDACKKWGRETCGKVQVDYELRVVTDQRIRLIEKLRVKEPSVAELLGDELYGEATCFMVWMPLPDCDCKALGVCPHTHHDYMWIPTSEQKALDDLKEEEPRDAACHELKHWVKNRMKNIGVLTIPSPDRKHKKQYWPKLRESLTLQTIQDLNKEISRRVAKRRKSTCGRGD